MTRLPRSGGTRDDQEKPQVIWLGRREVLDALQEVGLAATMLLSLALLSCWWLLPPPLTYLDALEKAGAAMVNDSNWVLTALLTLTVALYAVVIGEGIVDVDEQLAIALRKGMKLLSRILATVSLTWILLCLPVAWGHVRFLPDLIGVGIIGGLAVALAIAFPAFMFRPTDEVLGQYEAAERKLKGRFNAIPVHTMPPKHGWSGAIASTSANFGLGVIVLFTLGARDVFGIAVVAAFGSLVQTVGAFLILASAWSDRTNRAWVRASYAMLAYFLVVFAGLSIWLFSTGFGAAALSSACQLLLITLMVLLPAGGPAAWRWISLKGSAQRVASARLSRSLARQGVRISEVRARIPVPAPPKQTPWTRFRLRRRKFDPDPS